MKPYPSRSLDLSKRIFNCRLSRARRVVENVFGILASRFRVFKSTIGMEPERAQKIVLACCALHNFLRTKTLSRAKYTPSGTFDKKYSETHEVEPGQWRHESTGSFHPIIHQGGNHASFDARSIRDELCDYINSDGEVPWQWKMA